MQHNRVRLWQSPSASESCKPERLQGPKTQARARAERHGGWAPAGRGDCNTVVYTKLFERIVQAAVEYTRGQKNSVCQACTLWMPDFIVERYPVYTRAQNGLVFVRSVYTIRVERSVHCQNVHYHSWMYCTTSISSVYCFARISVVYLWRVYSRVVEVVVYFSFRVYTVAAFFGVQSDLLHCSWVYSCHCSIPVHFYRLFLAL